MLKKAFLSHSFIILVFVASALAGPPVAKAVQQRSPVEPGQAFQDNVMSLFSIAAEQRQKHCDDLLAAHPIQFDWICHDTGKDIADFLNEAHPASIL